MQNAMDQRTITATDLETTHPCWACAAPVANGTGQCDACGKIQPLGADTDYFAALGLPRRLTLDGDDLERRWHERARRFHPDLYRTGEPRERIVALENTALLNRAYRTLREPFSRAEYLVRSEEGAGAEIPSNPPQELFETILAIQERLMEYRLADPDERAALRPELERDAAAMQREYDAVADRLTAEIFPAWDALGDAAEPEARRRLLAAMKEAIGHRAYLRRVIQSLHDALATGPGASETNHAGN